MIRIGITNGTEVYWFDQVEGWIPLQNEVRGGRRSQLLELELTLVGQNSPAELRQRLAQLRLWERRQLQEQLELLIDDGEAIEAYTLQSLVVDDTPYRLPYWRQHYGTVRVKLAAVPAPRLATASWVTLAGPASVSTFEPVYINTDPVQALQVNLAHTLTSAEHPGCYTIVAVPGQGPLDVPLASDGVAHTGSFIARAERTELVAVVRGTPRKILPSRIAVAPPFDVVRAVSQPEPQTITLAAGELAVVVSPTYAPGGWTSHLGGAYLTAQGPAVLTVPAAEALIIYRGLTLVGAISGFPTVRTRGVTITLPGTGVRYIFGRFRTMGRYPADQMTIVVDAVPVTQPISTPLSGYLHEQNTLRVTVTRQVGDKLITRFGQAGVILEYSLLVFAVENPSTIPPNTYLAAVVEERPDGIGAVGEIAQIALPRHHVLSVEAISVAGYPVSLYLRPINGATWYRTPLPEDGAVTVRSLGSATSLTWSTGTDVGTLTLELSSGTLGLSRSTTRYAVGTRQLVSLGSFATDPGVFYRVRLSPTNGTVERLFALPRPRWLMVAAPGGTAQELHVESTPVQARVTVRGGLAAVDQQGDTYLMHESGWWTVSVRQWMRQALDEWGQGLPAIGAESVRVTSWNGEWLRRVPNYSSPSTVPLGIISPVPPPRRVVAWVIYQRTTTGSATINFSLQALTATGQVLSSTQLTGVPLDQQVRTVQLQLEELSPDLRGYVVTTNRTDVAYTILWGESLAGDPSLGLYVGDGTFGPPLRVSPPVVPGNHGRLTFSFTSGSVTIYAAESATVANALHSDGEMRRRPSSSGTTSCYWCVEPGQPFVVRVLGTSSGSPVLEWVLASGSSTQVTLSIGTNVLTVPANAVTARVYSANSGATVTLDWLSTTDAPSGVERVPSLSDLGQISLPVVPGMAWAFAFRYGASLGSSGNAWQFTTVDGATWVIKLEGASWRILRNDSPVLTVPRPQTTSPRTVLLTQASDGSLTLRVGQPGAWSEASTTMTPTELVHGIRLTSAEMNPVFAIRWAAFFVEPVASIQQGTAAALGSNDPADVWSDTYATSFLVYDPERHPFAVVRGLSRPGFVRGAITLDGPSTLLVVPQRDLLTQEIVDTTVTLTVRGAP